MDASVIIFRTCYTPKTLILFDLLVRNSLFAFTESVAELSADHLQVPHTTSSGCTAPLGLDTPSISSHASLRESTRSTNLLLDVEGDFTASTAKCVRLIAPFTKRTCSLSHSYLCSRNRTPC